MCCTCYGATVKAVRNSAATFSRKLTPSTWPPCVARRAAGRTPGERERERNTEALPSRSFGARHRRAYISGGKRGRTTRYGERASSKASRWILSGEKTPIVHATDRQFKSNLRHDRVSCVCVCVCVAALPLLLLLATRPRPDRACIGPVSTAVEATASRSEIVSRFSSRARCRSLSL